MEESGVYDFPVRVVERRISVRRIVVRVISPAVQMECICSPSETAGRTFKVCARRGPEQKAQSRMKQIATRARIAVSRLSLI